MIAQIIFLNNHQANWLVTLYTSSVDIIDESNRAENEYPKRLRQQKQRRAEVGPTDSGQTKAVFLNNYVLN